MLALVWKCLILSLALGVGWACFWPNEIVRIYGRRHLVAVSATCVGLAFATNAVFSDVRIGWEWVISASAFADDVTVFLFGLGSSIAVRLVTRLRR